MPADLELIASTWESLRPFLAEERCSGCECLQGALTELSLCLEDLSDSAERDTLLARVTGALCPGPPHACLGCQPCRPSDTLVNFYREQKRREAAPGCDCGAT